MPRRPRRRDAPAATAIGGLRLVGLLAALAGAGLAGQTPQLLRDLNTSPPPDPDSYARDFVVDDGGALWFVAETVPAGLVLLRDAGDGSGPVPIVDPEPTTRRGRVWGVTPFAGGVVFGLENDALGAEPWFSDGTPAGTRPIDDVVPGSAGCSPRDFTVAGGMVYFAAYRQQQGIELWRTDGSAAGTRLVIDAHAGAEHGNPGELTPLPAGGGLLFVVDDGVHGREPWVTDGSAAGSHLLADLAPGDVSSDAAVLGAVNGRLLLANGANGGPVLWTTDGSAAGTSALAGGPTTVPALPAVDDGGGRLFFAGWDAARGAELWLSDGTAAGTRCVVDLVPGSGSWTPRPIAALPAGGGIVMRSESRPGAGLWVSDGTASGTRQLAGVRPGWAAAAAGGQLLFRGDDGGSGEELWVTDGSAAGTALLVDLAPGSGSSAPAWFTSWGADVVFAADDGQLGVEPWRSDGTVAGTVLLANCGAVPATWTRGSAPEWGVDFRGAPVFLATPGGPRSTTPIRSDGSAAGTGIYPGIPAGYDFAQLNEHGNHRLHVTGGGLLMLASDAAHRTHAFFDAGGGLAYGSPVGLASGSRPLLDFAVQGDVAWLSGQELWQVRDGVARAVSVGGTQPPYARGLQVVGQELLFQAHTGGSDGLWTCDGTQAERLRAFPAARIEGPYGGRDRAWLVVRGEPTFGDEIWLTDGTAAGTRVLDLTPGPDGSDPHVLAPWGEALLFSARTASGGRGLLLTDGSVGGTLRLDPGMPGLPSGLLEPGVEMIACGLDRFAAVVDDGRHGAQPWVLSPQGVSMVGPLPPGAGGAPPRLLGAAGGVIYIIADGLWRSDGTAAGTRRLCNGPIGDELFVVSGGRVYFRRDDGVHGDEPWVVSAGATAKSVGQGCGVGLRAPWLEAADPVLGRDWRLRGGGGPAGAVGLVLVAPPAPKPLVLAGHCVCHLDLDVAAELRWQGDAAQTWSQDLRLPNLPALVGVQLCVQQFCAPTPQPAGVEVSNAVWLSLASR